MKYDIHICSCGRIHFVRMRDVTCALTANKELAVVCGGCGKVRITGANKGYDEYFEKDCFDMYRYNLQDKTEITRTQFKAGPRGKMLYKILYSEGIRVPMETGYFATKYNCNRFADLQYPDFLTETMRQMGVFDFSEFQKQYEKWRDDMNSVNMYRLVYNSGMTEDQLEQLSCLYMPETFDWTDFPYGYDITTVICKRNSSFNDGDFNFKKDEKYKIRFNEEIKRYQVFLGKGHIYLDERVFNKTFRILKKGVTV